MYTVTLGISDLDVESPEEAIKAFVGAIKDETLLYFDVAGPNGFRQFVEMSVADDSGARALEFIKTLADAVAESNGLVNDNTGALMTPESIRRTARHILKLDQEVAQ